jgi:hypothetical protein
MTKGGIKPNLFNTLKANYTDSNIYVYQILVSITTAHICVVESGWYKLSRYLTAVVMLALISSAFAVSPESLMFKRKVVLISFGSKMQKKAKKFRLTKQMCPKSKLTEEYF